jgi:hypothetical protein
MFPFSPLPVSTQSHGNLISPGVNLAYISVDVKALLKQRHK